MSFPFNVRVYGILVIDGSVLLVQEPIQARSVLKFPGGGLEFGEGTRDCVEREFLEETGCSIRAGAHIYTTDFFQASWIDPSQQILSIYYQVELVDAQELIKIQPEGALQFKWVALAELEPDMLSLPIDRRVAAMLLSLA